MNFENITSSLVVFSGFLDSLGFIRIIIIISIAILILYFLLKFLTK